MIYQQLLYFSKTFEVELVVWKDNASSIKKKLSKSDEFDPLGKNIKLTLLNNSETAPEPITHRLLRVLKSLFSDVASPELYYYPEVYDQIDQMEPADYNIFHYSFCHPWLQLWTAKPRGQNVVCFHNLESDLFSSRTSSEKNWIFRTIHRNNMEKLLRHEAALAKLADELWFISLRDRQIFSRRNRGEDSKYRLTSPIYDEQILIERQNQFQTYGKKNDEVILGFIGGLDFEPNQKSLHWLLDHVAPILKSTNFTGTLRVVGRHPTEDLVRKAKQFPFVKIEGFVDDLTEYWASLSLMLVPHITGSGVRIKLIESIASGIPVLANNAAVERIHPDICKSPLITVSNKPEEWANHILSLQGSDLRRSFIGHPIDPGLSAESIYKFLQP